MEIDEPHTPLTEGEGVDLFGSSQDALSICEKIVADEKMVATAHEEPETPFQELPVEKRKSSKKKGGKKTANLISNIPMTEEIISRFRRSSEPVALSEIPANDESSARVKRKLDLVTDFPPLPSHTRDPLLATDGNVNTDSQHDVEYLRRKKIHSDNVLKNLPERYVKLISNRYNDTFLESYIVFLEEIIMDRDGSIEQSINGIGVIKLAVELNKCKEMARFLAIATEFRRRGNNKFSLFLPSAKTADSFVQEVLKRSKVLFPGKCWVAYVPTYKIYKKVFLTGVDDSDVDPELLKQNIRPPVDWRAF